MRAPTAAEAWYLDSSRMFHGLRSRSSTDSASGKRGRVVLVDADIRVQRAAAAALSLSGFEVILVMNVSDRALVLDHVAPDLIVIDVDAHEASGVELVRGLRLRKPLLPIALLGRQPEVHVAVQLFRLGVVDYITKLPPLFELLARIERALLRGHALRRTSSCV